MKLDEIMGSRKPLVKPTMSYRLTRLKKDGQPSRMNDASEYFYTMDDAIRAHNHRVDVNPGKVIANRLTQLGGDLGEFEMDLIGRYEG